MQLRRLGRSDIEITPLGLGCWQFSGGEGLVGSFWSVVPQPEANAIVAAALAGGINWFDTAEVYGWGNSERSLAAALKAAGRANGDVIVATKWWPTLRTAGHLRRSIDQRLECLDGFGIDLYQIHQPASISSVRKSRTVRSIKSGSWNTQVGAGLDFTASSIFRHCSTSRLRSRMK